MWSIWIGLVLHRVGTTLDIHLADQLKHHIFTVRSSPSNILAKNTLCIQNVFICLESITKTNYTCYAWKNQMCKCRRNNIHIFNIKVQNRITSKQFFSTWDLPNMCGENHHYSHPVHMVFFGGDWEFDIAWGYQWGIFCFNVIT